jgi:hypothetical protein
MSLSVRDLNILYNLIMNWFENYNLQNISDINTYQFIIPPQLINIRNDIFQLNPLFYKNQELSLEQQVQIKELLLEENRISRRRIFN